MQGDQRGPHRQDTFDLREQIHSDDHQHLQAHADAAMNYGTDDEEHSVLEDDSEADEGEDYIEEDDMSSTLSIPNESIDFDMVYALHSFAATVEGQANVVKGDSLYLMDDTNSYWWLVRVLKTQEVGYIPAENIETPFERLARLNKHRNIDLASATQEEQNASEDRLRQNLALRAGSNQTPSPLPNRTGSRANQSRNVHFTAIRSHYRYIPPLREGEIEEEDDEWDVEGFEDEDLDLASEQMYMQSMEEDAGPGGMELDDGMQWDDAAADDLQARQMRGNGSSIPDALQPGSLREQQQQQLLRAQQLQQQQQQQQELLAQQQQQQQQQMQRQQQQQQIQQQQQQQMAAQQQATQKASQAQQQTLQQQQNLRTSGSRERLSEESSTQGSRRIDPAEATETRKMTVTPTIAREYDGQPYPPSIIIEKQQEEERAKRIRDDDSISDESSLRKKTKGKDKMAAPVSSATLSKPSPAKLRKEPSRESRESKDTDDEGKDKKKKSSVFGRLFNPSKKEKGKENKNPSIGSVESTEYISRGSEDSSRSGHRPSPSDGTMSPTTTVAQQQQQAISLRNAASDIRTSSQDQSAPSTPERSTTPQVSQHASQLRQRDQQQQALYQQYLNRSPSSPPEAQPSYGLQSASAVMLTSPSTNSALGPPVSRPRPGSLILTSPSSNEHQPNLSVIRVFAGRNLQTEATFKTVLLNPSTTASDLVRQAIQRFRLPSAEEESDYYLTVKQVEGGGFAVLKPQEHPLGVFETLVVEATELPKVKRSSVGSISSVSSNLSMHPAIKKLSMNDFTDDSAVKFYLNRRGDGNADDSINGHEGDDTLIADSSHDTEMLSPSRSQYLNVATAGANVTPERFTSPSIRFPLQLVIYAEDLPDDMQFHPMTEAIVSKNTISDPHVPITVSPNLRRKVFMFPKNVTVAEVTEIGLERFGIQDGVIDGGDEVEDKMTKRRSTSRVRYGLAVSIEGHERELSPSSKIIDAFLRPPQYRTPDRQAALNKRRSLDATQLLGTIDDVRPDDPVFVLRRAISYRNSTSRRRFSAPLDEIALQQLHRESTSSYNSEAQSPVEENKLKQPSRQEIIAAQRAATRANQRALVSAQTNSVRGMDVLLPGNAMLRSSRYDTADKMRYSYVEPDGETYDISDIIEEEWRDMSTNKNDLLEGVFNRNRDGIGEKLDRFLHKIRKGKGKERDFSTSSVDSSRNLSLRSASPSEYSVDDAEGRSRSATPGSAPLMSRMPSGNETPVHIRPLPSTANATAHGEDRSSRPGTTTPTGTPRAAPGSRRNPSIASVISDQSGRGTPPVQSNLSRVDEEKTRTRTSPKNPQRRPIIPKDDFGLSHMMAVIEFKASTPKKTTRPMDPVDELLFGTPLDLESLHPQVRDIYASGFKQLDEMDKILDTYIGRSVVGAF
ncbi:hypothetical protein B0H34DRAFT_855276 [Crassisporium funariophilum]|nr:hypothetical protein B0H34DRAFT_855276 [Crassisporium funariophilum]